MSALRPSSTLPPVIYGRRPADYHDAREHRRGDPKKVMSRSELGLFHRCPSKWIQGFKEESTDATDWGDLIDCLFLTPDLFESTYAIAPETYPAEPKKKGEPAEDKPWNWNATFCKAWRAEQESAGKTVIKSSEASAGHLAVSRLKADSLFADLLAASKTQVQINVEYEDPQTGIVVPIKCLLDLLPDPSSKFGNTIADLKTTVDAEPATWVKHVYKYGLMNQSALYLDATNAATGLDYVQFGHLVQESHPPYETSRRLMDAEYIQIGRATYMQQLVEYCWCLKNNTWPSYDDWKGDLTTDGWRIVKPKEWMFLTDI